MKSSKLRILPNVPKNFGGSISEILPKVVILPLFNFRYVDDLLLMNDECQRNINLIFFRHVDDLTMTADGVDTYHMVKDAKRYR